ncbi:DNA-binding response regulator [Desulfosarcina alkanivorans]|uniref:DNA-binding response regulator n=1 Tax=Desulfosarcina alkanivorans TaxID=571177 RepID=A0A5K7YYR6_9BACT|nr:response regulator transcription factor [Desulfosarcina alkanivorans]BBO72301.1 DNA-binding response regulator [Desulfosarcina alkanivorans]
MAAYRIIIADDHLLMRKGLRMMIETQSDLHVSGEAGDGIELLKLLRKTTPDMVLVDVAMPRLRGIEAVGEIRSTYPGIRILVVSMHKNREYIYHAFAAGADGYLLKEDSDSELILAIQTVRRGQKFLSPLLQQDLPDDLVFLLRHGGNPEAPLLSVRESEVLKLVAEGAANKDIAGILSISNRTVEHHRASIMKKLQLKSLADLVKYAIRKGYTTSN